jgi:hypothetical protein
MMSKETVLVIVDMIRNDLEKDLVIMEDKWNQNVNPSQIVGFAEESIRVAMHKLLKLTEENK